MKFVMNVESKVKVAVEGKSQAAIREEILGLGGNISKGSLSKLLSGGADVVCGFTVVEMTGEPEGTRTVVTGVADAGAQVGGQTAEVLNAPSENGDSAKENVAEDTGAEETQAAPQNNGNKANWASALLGLGSAPAAPNGANNTPAKPAAAPKANNNGAKRGEPTQFFAAQNPDLMKVVNEFPLGKVMRAVQNRILIIQEKAAPQHVVHVNVLKTGFSITEYREGKSTRFSKKVDDLAGVAATLTELIKPQQA